MRKHGMILAIVTVVVGWTVSAQAGGRAQVEVSQAPRHVNAGQSFDLTIQVKPQWLQRRNVEPLVVAECGKLKVTTTAVALAQPNAYRASLKLPAAGAWKVRVDSRYCETIMKPLEIQALASVASKR